MTRTTETVPAEFFDALYREDPDPWDFATSDYERAKYAATLAALPSSRYRRGLEIGCSIGVLTRQLAGRCNALLGVDLSEAALAQARERCRDLDTVVLARMTIPRSLPNGRFDLIVISEVGYYWSRTDLAIMARFAAERLERGGHLVLVHWIEGGADKPLDGNEVHDRFLAEPGLTALRDENRDPYRLTVLQRS
ncbi:MAG: methyltransferase domain-containing protein [Alphaproteobacteria bacterium]|nr:methyltransferase domain-containing protein [Alphaproteobacteria bacterium]